MLLTAGVVSLSQLNQESGHSVKMTTVLEAMSEWLCPSERGESYVLMKEAEALIRWRNDCDFLPNNKHAGKKNSLKG